MGDFPTRGLTNEQTAVAAVTVTSALTFNNMNIPEDEIERADFRLDLVTSLELLFEPIEGNTIGKIIAITYGNAAGRRRASSRLLQAATGPTTVITFEIVQMVGVRGDITAIERKLRQDVAAALDVEGAKRVLETPELQKYGDFSLGKIETDLGDGSVLITDTASPTISVVPTNSPKKNPTKGGKAKTSKKSKATKTSKVRKNTQNTMNTKQTEKQEGRPTRLSEELRVYSKVFINKSTHETPCVCVRHLSRCQKIKDIVRPFTRSTCLSYLIPSGFYGAKSRA